MGRSLNSVELTVVVDAKDVHDKANSDTSSFGSQKSLAFTVAWLRSVLRRPNTTLRWTSTENMWVDSGTKEMDLTHMRRILKEGHWSVEYSPVFVKQVSKGRAKPSAAPAGPELPGEALSGSEPVMGHLLRLGELCGWHQVDDAGVNVAFDARSFSPVYFKDHLWAIYTSVRPVSVALFGDLYRVHVASESAWAPGCQGSHPDSFL